MRNYIKNQIKSKRFADQNNAFSVFAHLPRGSTVNKSYLSQNNLQRAKLFIYLSFLKTFEVRSF